ncbi:hypothetical protein EON83_13510 [bacterium]|nr:MAG: hypothetical protein EON83_13510 [bacterium]
MEPKTDLPCDCGSITFEMSEPDSAVSLVHNMFVINGHWCMYFCPFCGGKLPDDSKPIYVPYVTTEERERLEALVKGIETPEEVIERLGKPEYDELMLTYFKQGEPMPFVYSGSAEEQSAIQESGEFTLDESVVPTRNIEFYGLSKTANLEFYFEGGRLTMFRIMSKGLPPRHLEEGEVV